MHMHGLRAKHRKQHNHSTSRPDERNYACQQFWQRLWCLYDVLAEHMRTATLTSKPFSQPVISSARFSAPMLSSSIDVSLCSVNAAHMHSRGLFDRMSIFLWPRFMLLAYAIFKVQPDAKNFFRPRLNFSNPPAS